MLWERQKPVFGACCILTVIAASFVHVYAQGTGKDNAIPQWNRNGRIYFRSGPPGKRDVYSIKTDGTDLKPFITSSGEDYAPRWTHGGKRGVFMSERDGDYEIYSINVDGTGEKRLTFSKGNHWDPGW